MKQIQEMAENFYEKNIWDLLGKKEKNDET